MPTTLKNKSQTTCNKLLLNLLVANLMSVNYNSTGVQYAILLCIVIYAGRVLISVSTGNTGG